jgi:hypothetical protein
MTAPAQTLKAKLSLRFCDESAASRRTSPASLLCGVFLALSTLGASSALASGNESWASETIEQMRQHSFAGEGGSRASLRRSPVERLNGYMIDEEQIRPRQHARRHDRSEEYLPPRRSRAHRESRRRVASLGRVSAPAEPARTGAASGQVVASLGPTPASPPTAAVPKLSGAPINWVASANCLASSLRSVLAEVAALFGPVRVNSTCRSRAHNARVGGATHSYHLTGNAVDFRMRGNFKAVSHYLLSKRSVGGFKHYGAGVFHIDTGPRRTWASSRRSHRG